jgi:hypothetical protein
MLCTKSLVDVTLLFALIAFQHVTDSGPSPDKFYKGRSQEKTHFLRLEFFLLRSPFDRAKSVLTDRAMCSVVGQGSPVV